MKMIMKKIFISIVISLFSLSSFALDVPGEALKVMDSELGDRTIYLAQCWSFGATSITTGTYALAGTYGIRTNNVSSLSATSTWIKTPWITPHSGNITMKAKIAENGARNSRGVIFYYVPYEPLNIFTGEGIPVKFAEYWFDNLSAGTLRDISVAMPSTIVGNGQPFKIRISFVGDGGTGRMAADNINIPATFLGCTPVVAPVEFSYPKGYLIFEDNWPSKADYDFNDLVALYDIKGMLNSSNNITELTAKFVVKASGAGYNNAFCLQLDGIAPNKIQSVTGSNLNGGQTLFTLSGNGSEAGQTYANIVIFQSSNTIMPSTGGVGANTDPRHSYVTPKTIELKIKFNSGVSRTDLQDITKFNFYLVADQTRGKEVHLPDFKPTSKANTSLFGTGHDFSNGSDRFYKTASGLPWGLNIVVDDFEYSIEKISIDKAYTKFVEWAESSGVLFPDWYLNSLYKNRTNIYTIPQK